MVYRWVYGARVDVSVDRTHSIPSAPVYGEVSAASWVDRTEVAQALLGMRFVPAWEAGHWA